MSSQKSADLPFKVSAIRAFSLMAILYVLLIFLLPANYQTLVQYHLSLIEYHVLLFSIILPSIVVWFAAFYGYAKLRHYASSISSAPESADFDRLATGCAWLAWSLPLPAIIALLLDTITTTHPGFHAATVIITEYMNLLLPLIAFSIIGSAARNLINRSNVRFTESNLRSGLLILVAGGVVYCYLAFRQLTTTSLGSTDNPYFLPVWLMLISVTIPYLYAWIIGLLAAYEINAFSKHVQGLFYRQSLHLLVGGLSIVIFSLIAIQYVGSIEPNVGRLIFDYKLILITVFRMIGGIGFLLIALGANRLKKIEEV